MAWRAGARAPVSGERDPVDLDEPAVARDAVDAGGDGRVDRKCDQLETRLRTCDQVQLRWIAEVELGERRPLGARDQTRRFRSRARSVGDLDPAGDDSRAEVEDVDGATRVGNHRVARSHQAARTGHQFDGDRMAKAGDGADVASLMPSTSVSRPRSVFATRTRVPSIEAAIGPAPCGTEIVPTTRARSTSTRATRPCAGSRTYARSDPPAWATPASVAVGSDERNRCERRAPEVHGGDTGGASPRSECYAGNGRSSTTCFITSVEVEALHAGERAQLVILEALVGAGRSAVTTRQEIVRIAEQPLGLYHVGTADGVLEPEQRLAVLLPHRHEHEGLERQPERVGSTTAR